MLLYISDTQDMEPMVLFNVF